MAIWLGSRAVACTVTLIAISSTTGIMNPRTTQEGCGGMAIVTAQSGVKVGRVGFGTLTGRGYAVMAGLTTVNYACMINRCTDKCTGVMTDTTILAGWNMRGWFVDSKTGTMT